MEHNVSKGQTYNAKLKLPFSNGVHFETHHKRKVGGHDLFNWKTVITETVILKYIMKLLTSSL